MAEAQPEVWLRGPVAGVPPLLMPVAHALLGALEDLEKLATPLGVGELWSRPGGAASIGFHLRHVAGSTGRLLTYARGESLSADQRESLVREGEPGSPPADAAALLRELRMAVERAVEQLRGTVPEHLAEARKVGRAGLPSTALGLLFHAAEHAQRHTGQAIATAKVLRAGLS